MKSAPINLFIRPEPLYTAHVRAPMTTEVVQGSQHSIDLKSVNPQRAAKDERQDVLRSGQLKVSSELLKHSP